MLTADITRTAKLFRYYNCQDLCFFVMFSVVFKFQSVSCMRVTSLIPVLELHALVN